ncbi:MAG: nitrilase-related carbon-nitrogen hydrolase [Oligoflexus sp.]
MDILRVAASTLNQVPMDWSGNQQRIIEKIHAAREQHAALILFPELCITGYNCEDMFFSLHTARKAEECVLAIAKHTQDIVTVLGLPVYYQGAMYNCAVFVQNGKVIGLNPKKVLPREGVHYETRWFEAWRFGVRETAVFGGQDVPIGDLRYQFGDVGVGVEICEEAWDSEGAAAAHALAGTELIVNPSASHFALGKYQVRETLVADASRSMRVHYLYTNLVGLESGRLIYDGGILLGECGTITARGHRFSFSDGDLFVRDIDLNTPRVTKLRFRSMKHLKAVQPTGLAVFGEPLPKVKTETPDIDAEYLKEGHSLMPKEDEFLWAQMLGLFDYLRKTGGKGYVLSLSGGCDSSSLAVLVAHTIAQVQQEIGSDGLAKRLNWQVDRDGAIPKTAKEWIARLLLLAYQATENSGPVTRKAARELAAELGAEFHELDVQGFVSNYVQLAESVLGRHLTWEQDDLALQNIQARSRAPMIWLLANLRQAILLTTSNRSEAAVGYATMDGDTAGGLSPLGGIDKTFLRAWLRWAESKCSYGLGALASLKYVNEQDPTAELRPKGSSQKDEADLMPYEILNFIEKCLVRDRMGPESILGRLIQRFPQFERSNHEAFLQRFLKLWTQNQWKRERYAPSFHLDDESLDPKTWCRFPILSSGFRDEIKGLKHWENPLDTPPDSSD